jgi:sterol desaturase/sphingolipid hydroxylase (fatty acid hydroxylase superfamily)
MVASPIFLLLVIAEALIIHFKGKTQMRLMDVISSLSSGMTNSVKDVLGLSVSIMTYPFLLKKFAFFTIENTVLTYVIVFVVLDFKGYWVHRWSHKINFFWNKHAIHHSSEDFNLACALRQTISYFVNFFTFFFIPAAILGVPAQVVAVVAPLHLFSQFWYHTELIGKMGFLEHIIVTPSHHRVHHAVNQEYMDKNMSEVFIVWDKLFGTFQEELPHVPPVYGISRPAQTWNPIKINFQHLFLLINDALRTKNIGDKFRIWWKPTGWRPADVEAAYPVAKIEDVYSYQKYEPQTSFALKIWSLIQMLTLFGIITLFYGTVAKIGFPNMLYYGTFIFMSVYSFTELMDKNPNALLYEIIKNAFGLYLIFRLGSWFNIDDYIPFGTYMMLAYFFISTLTVAYFVFGEIKKVIKI